jgi:hypothetical protein
LAEAYPAVVPSCTIAMLPHGAGRTYSPNPYLPAIAAAPRGVVMAAYDAGDSTRPPWSARFHFAKSLAVEQMPPFPKICDGWIDAKGVAVPCGER